jgi:hypothetical protein
MYTFGNENLYKLMREDPVKYARLINNSKNLYLPKKPSRAVIIPKSTFNPDGSRKMRIIEVPAMNARLYIGCVSLIFNLIGEEFLSNQQYGFRIGKPGYLAWKQIIKILKFNKSQNIAIGILIETP